MELEMFDVHSHILFDIDDGAFDLEMSIEMLKMAYEHGIRKMVCSSHSWAMSDDYHKNIELLKAEAADKGIGIELYKGCEIACYGDTDRVFYGIEHGLYPALGETNLYLLEFDPDELASRIVMFVEDLGKRLDNANIEYKFVIAHIERCWNLWNNMEAVERLLEIGCLFQINAYSLESERDERMKGFARMLVEKKLATFLGSDCHKLFHRPPYVWPGLKCIWDNCDEEYAGALCYGNAERYLVDKRG